MPGEAEQEAIGHGLSAAGAAVGGYFGGPIGASIGGKLGGALGSSLFGSSSAKRAAAARRRGLRQMESNVEQYGQQVEVDRATSIADIERTRARARAEYQNNLRLIDDDRRLSGEQFDRTRALSLENLEAIESDKRDALESYRPYQEAGEEASGLLRDIYSGGTAADEAFATFRDSTGYRHQLEQGLGAVDTRVSARGLRGSGAQQKAIAKFVSGLADSSFKSFSEGLEKQAGLGEKAAYAADQSRREYQNLSINERRKMQTQVDNLMAQYRNANAKERDALGVKIDRMVATNGAMRETLKMFLEKRAGVWNSKNRIIAARTNVNAQEIADRSSEAQRRIGIGSEIAGHVGSYLSSGSSLGAQEGVAPYTPKQQETFDKLEGFTY